MFCASFATPARWLGGVPSVLFLCSWAAGPVSAEPARYTIDPARTVTRYDLGSLQSGTFDRHTGSILLDWQAQTGSVDVGIESASVRSGVALMDYVLQGAEVFNVQQHPRIRFLGDQFLFTGDRLNAVAGQLTLLGKTMPVLLQVSQFACHTPVLPETGPEVCSGQFDTTIDRTDFGLDIGVSLGVPKAVHLQVQVYAVRQPGADGLVDK